MTLRKIGLASCAIASFGAAAAPFDLAPWETRQTFRVAAPGAMRITLPASALNAARPDLGDVRLLDPDGMEVPFAIVGPAPTVPGRETRHPLTARLLESTTVLELTLGQPEAASRVVLETPHDDFVKAATVETADPARNWRTITAGALIFRHASGAAQLSLDLGNAPISAIRITIDDAKSAPVPFSHARLIVGEIAAPPPESVPAHIVSAESSGGETRIILDLGARNLPVTGIVLNPSDDIFSRRVRLVTRFLSDTEARESLRDLGSISRLRLEGGRSFEKLDLALPAPIADSRAELSIDNGDSPPLSIKDASVLLRPVHLAFQAKATGQYTLLSGHPAVPGPRYDVAAFVDEWRRLPATSLQWSDPERNPAYRPSQPSNEIPDMAGPFHPEGWRHRRAVTIHRPGAQILELDPVALAASRHDYSDIRIARAGRQIPYLLERTCRSRLLQLSFASAPDPEHPEIHRWRLELPAEGVPISRLNLTIGEPVFERNVRVYEIASNDRGDARRRTLGSAHWIRHSGTESPRQVIPLQAPPTSAQLYLEIDHGDNSAFAPVAVEAAYPVIRLHFRAAEPGEVELAYGNDRAAAPHYDIQLVAQRLLTAHENIATLAAPDAKASSIRKPFTLAGRSGRILFWGSLGLAVAILLWAVAKLLPGPQDPKKP
ncbi:MAG TPA: hypothetical protein PLU30_19810 [Verrucomicrobiae bacterium]|mgnify:CR=1 FL=1|nr:hypothetical protein [Verrucomicrobiae bacterium]